MAGHAQLKFVMTECSKTQIHLTGLTLCMKPVIAQMPTPPVTALAHLYHCISEQKPMEQMDFIPDYCVCTVYKLWFRVPLMIRDKVSGLKPDPLLTFGKKPVVTRCPLTCGHH